MKSELDGVISVTYTYIFKLYCVPIQYTKAMYCAYMYTYTWYKLVKKYNVIALMVDSEGVRDIEGIA